MFMAFEALLRPRDLNVFLFPSYAYGKGYYP